MDPGTIHLMVWYHDPGWIHGILSLVMTSITDGTEHRGLRTAQPVVWVPQATPVHTGGMALPVPSWMHDLGHPR